MMFSKMILCASVLMLGEVPVSGEEPQAVQTAEQGNEKSAENRDSSTAETAKQPASDEANAKKEKAEDRGTGRARGRWREACGYRSQYRFPIPTKKRARYGLEPFKVDKELMETAREHAAWMDSHSQHDSHRAGRCRKTLRWASLTAAML